MTDLVVKVLRPIWNSKTETAVRLRGRIESILDWATVSKYRHGENPARWRGHLGNLLANPNKIAPVSNFPALPWREITAFMADLVQREGAAALAVQFAIMTACRSLSAGAIAVLQQMPAMALSSSLAEHKIRRCPT